MRKILFVFGALLAFAACTNKPSTVVEKGTVSDADSTVVSASGQEDAYSIAIDRYLADTIGSQYLKGEHCVPIHTIVAASERDAGDILVWGDFWVFNYNQVGDTLKCVSGGSHPGLMHLRQTEQGFEVTAFDRVGDGADFLQTAQKIFGDKYDAFQTVNSDEQKREALRARVLADYVKEHHLAVTLYQDYGWPAKALPLANE